MDNDSTRALYLLDITSTVGMSEMYVSFDGYKVGEESSKELLSPPSVQVMQSHNTNPH